MAVEILRTERAMSGQPGDDRPTYGDADPRYDDFPITEEGAERTDVEWIGLGGATGAGSPYLYEPRDETVYRGRVDEANERVELRPETAEPVEESALGEYVEDLGEEHGWEWLSEFAREYLGAEDEPAANGEGDER